MDRLILELRLLPEDCYLKMNHTINEVNRILAEAGSDQLVSPLKGNVVFSSAFYGWSFTLESFAAIYSEYHPSVDYKKFAKRLWGDIWFDPTSRKFTRTSPPEGDLRPRSFVQFIMAPLHKIYSHVIGQNPEELAPLLTELDIHLNQTELNYNPQALTLHYPLKIF